VEVSCATTEKQLNNYYFLMNNPQILKELSIFVSPNIKIKI